MSGLSCPNCDSTKFKPEYEQDGLYVCKECGKVIGYYCNGCGRFYSSNRLGIHGDVYECKLCGKIQWGYTEYKRAGEGQ